MAGAYCTLSDINDEGFIDPPYTNARINTVITLACNILERVTGRWFEPRDLDLTLDGTGNRALRFRDPIISVTTVELDGVAVDIDDLVVYNRHVAQNMTRPDDRDDPRIEINTGIVSGIYSTGRWPEGQQIIRVVGKFGYTDYDSGDVEGQTPPLINHLCKLLVVRELPFLSDRDAREDLRGRGRITQKKTRDQSITFGAGGATGGALSRLAMGLWTGDAEVDSLIAMYRRPGNIRSV
jgi:hypothetical protein